MTTKLMDFSNDLIFFRSDPKPKKFLWVGPNPNAGNEMATNF